MELINCADKYLTGLYAHCDFKVYKTEELDGNGLMEDLQKEVL